MRTCTWLKPRAGHVAVFIGKGKLIAQSGRIHVGDVGDPDVQWGQVAAVGPASSLQVGDVVVLMRFNGIEAPSPHHGLEVVVLKEDNILSVVDVEALKAEAQKYVDEEKAAGERLRLAAEEARGLRAD